MAPRARISKRTFCHRFPDKAVLFGAVVHRIIEGRRPPAGTLLYEGGSLEEVLRHLARLILRVVLTPMALSLNRLMVAEAQRLPELAAAIVAREGGRAEVVGQIALMLEREARDGGMEIDHPVFAAEQFLQLVVPLPQRRALGLSTPMTESELDAWVNDCVNLFPQRLPLLVAELAEIGVNSLRDIRPIDDPPAAEDRASNTMRQQRCSPRDTKREKRRRQGAGDHPSTDSVADGTIAIDRDMLVCGFGSPSGWGRRGSNVAGRQNFKSVLAAIWADPMLGPFRNCPSDVASACSKRRACDLHRLCA